MSTRFVEEPFAKPLKSEDRKIVRRIEKDPWNRLHSIAEDAEWVRLVAESLSHLPVVPNLRCGAWYIPCDLRTTSSSGAGNSSVHSQSTFCYFKSTDGHAGEWAFSLKRPNLAVADLILSRGGAIIVDSTRRGKSLPDALSKTIPIWCAVLNEASKRKYGVPAATTEDVQQLVAQAQHRDDGGNVFRQAHFTISGCTTGLVSPRHQVPPSEHEQIEARISSWAEELLASDLPVPRLERPLVPHFLNRPNEPVEERNLLHRLGAQQRLSSDIYPVVLLGASRRVDTPCPSLDGRYYYTQGSGDDEELWSNGLTPEMFQDALYRARLLTGPPDLILANVRDVVETVAQQKAAVNGRSLTSEPSTNDDTCIGGTIFHYGLRSSHTLPSVNLEQGNENRSIRQAFDLVIHCTSKEVASSAQCTEKQLSSEQAKSADVGVHVHLDVVTGKKGLQTFRRALPRALSATAGAIARANGSPRILVAVEDKSANDIAIATLTALLANFYSAQRILLVSPEEQDRQRASLTKEELRRRLQWVITSLPDANPSRAHMLRVNEVLLSPAYSTSA